MNRTATIAVFQSTLLGACQQAGGYERPPIKQQTFVPEFF